MDNECLLQLFSLGDSGPAVTEYVCILSVRRNIDDMSPSYADVLSELAMVRI